MGNQPSIDAEAVQGLTNALTTIARQFPVAPGGGAQPPLPPPSGPPPVPAAPSAPAAAAAPPVPAAPNAPAAAAAAAPPVPPVPGEGGAPLPPVPFPPMPGPPGYWGPEQPPHEGWLRRCRFCGHQAYWRSGICINERCRVAWLHLVFFCVLFFFVSAFFGLPRSATLLRSLETSTGQSSGEARRCPGRSMWPRRGQAPPSAIYTCLQLQQETLIKASDKPYLRALKAKLETLIKKSQNPLIKVFNLN